MDMNEYQRLASTTANMDLDPELMLASYALGLTGEAGEVADLVKKHVAHGHDLDNDKYFKELGDVLWYVAQAARVRGMSLSDVAEANIEKLRKRYPEGFSEAASKARVDTNEQVQVRITERYGIGIPNLSSELADSAARSFAEATSEVIEKRRKEAASLPNTIMFYNPLTMLDMLVGLKREGYTIIPADDPTSMCAGYSAYVPFNSDAEERYVHALLPLDKLKGLSTKVRRELDSLMGELGVGGLGTPADTIIKAEGTE